MRDVIAAVYFLAGGASAWSNAGERNRHVHAFADLRLLRESTVLQSGPPYPAALRQRIGEASRTGEAPAALSREFGRSTQTVITRSAQAAIDAGRPYRAMRSHRSAVPVR